MKFVKMHGIGNDYVYIDAFSTPELETRFLGGDGAALIQRMSDRHRGVGSDGVILVCRPLRSRATQVRMRMFNADGSESEMCGNGIRCVAKFAHDRLGIRARPMKIETGRGTLEIDYDVEGGRLVSATVDMGEPILTPEQIPVEVARTTKRLCEKIGMTADARLGEPRNQGGGPEVRPTKSTSHTVSKGAGVVPGQATAASGLLTIRVGDESLDFHAVSMGNPHAIFYEPATNAQRLTTLGPMIEHHPAFPKRVNAHFVEWLGDREVRMVTWERGAGATLACGTGACAVAVAGIRHHARARDVLVHLPGGDLRVCWDEHSNHVLMTGPAADVFEGEWPEG